MLTHLNCLVPSCCRILPQRCAHYQISKTGQKVLVSTRTRVRSSKEKWQNVSVMGSEKELRQINKILNDERMHVENTVAKETAHSKLQQLKDRLLSAGFCRERKSYSPPENVHAIINEIVTELFGNADDQNSLSDPKVKFQLLIKCAERLNHEVDNSELFRMKTVGDVRMYYLKEVQGNNSYHQLVNNSQQLPKNLYVIPEPIRFDAKTDTFFGGVSAYPGQSNEVTGLRLKKKFPTSADNFVWPDV